MCVWASSHGRAFLHIMENTLEQKQKSRFHSLLPYGDKKLPLLLDRENMILLSKRSSRPVLSIALRKYAEKHNFLQFFVES